jgi:hypothetical protein
MALTTQPDPTATGWRFALGRAGESLRAVADDMPPADTQVALPHRALRPNSAMWYERTLELPAHAPIAVEADDGAQVFVDGVQWEQDRRVFHPPSLVGAGSHAVVVRVLNNAMQGGLRRVTVLDRRPQYPAPALPRPRAGFDTVDSASFRSRMPAPGAPCDFTLWADSQSGWKTFAAIVARRSCRSSATTTMTASTTI